MRSEAARLWERLPPEAVVQEVELLSEAECGRVRDQVRRLRPHWTRRHPTLPFYSLGAANYFDLVGPDPPYSRLAKAKNQVLIEHLGWLYDRLAERLRAHLGEPVGFAIDLALPGFHVFEFDKAFETPRDVSQPELFRQGYRADAFSNPIHCDKAHLVVEWGERRGLDLTHPISFTMAVATPSCGAGMYLWDVHYDETLALPSDYGIATLAPLLASRRRHLHRYRLGWAALHAGLNLHQPEPARELEPGCDERMTLQGHGLRRDGIWQLFW